MSKVAKLIDDIRDTLSDPDGDRWRNDRLIRAINEGMRDINLKSKVLRSKGEINLIGGISTYTLPDDVQAITKVIHNGVVLPFKSHSDMDIMSETWESDIGDEIQYIIYDKLNRGQIRTYPIIASSVESLSSAYGVVTSITDFTFNSPYGVLVDLNEDRGNLVMYYIKKPSKVSGLNDTLELDDSWDKALKHYVCGMTLRDDKDTQNRVFGGEEIQLYIGEVQLADIDASKNFTDGAKYETAYRRF